MISDRTANVVIGVVLTVWAGNVVAGIFAINGYQADPGINAIFTGTVGLAFVVRARAKGHDDEDKAKRKGKRK